MLLAALPFGFSLLGDAAGDSLACVNGANAKGPVCGAVPRPSNDNDRVDNMEPDILADRILCVSCVMGEDGTVVAWVLLNEARLEGGFEGVRVGVREEKGRWDVVEEDDEEEEEDG